MVIPSGNSAISLTSLGKVTERVNKLAENCWDDFISRDDISFQDLDTVLLAGEPHPLKPVAQRSIANRLGIPLQYLKKCPAELSARNLNFWITQEKNEELFFRFDNDSVRAIFTKKYQPVDNPGIMSRLSEIGYGEETRVQCSLDPDFMTLSIPDGNKTFSVNGEKITPGISVINSETGLSSLHVKSFFMVLICSNGLISQTEYTSSYRHVSQRIIDELPVVLENVSQGLMKQRDKFRLSVASKVDDPQSTIKSFNRQFQLSEQEQKAVEWAWPLEAGNTMYNILQIYSRAAQANGLGAESCHRLQKMSGDILSMLN